MAKPTTTTTTNPKLLRTALLLTMFATDCVCGPVLAPEDDTGCDVGPIDLGLGPLAGGVDDDLACPVRQNAEQGLSAHVEGPPFSAPIAVGSTIAFLAEDGGPLVPEGALITSVNPSTLRFVASGTSTVDGPTRSWQFTAHDPARIVVDGFIAGQPLDVPGGHLHTRVGISDDQDVSLLFDDALSVVTSDVPNQTAVDLFRVCDGGAATECPPCHVELTVATCTEGALPIDLETSTGVPLHIDLALHPDPRCDGAGSPDAGPGG